MPKYIDLTGQQFGRFTVIKKVSNPNSRDAMWECQCECGTIKNVLGKNLRNGRSKSCGCYAKERSAELLAERNRKNTLDISNDKYGLLTPLHSTEKRSSQGSIIWECKCDCGNITYVSVDALRGQHPIRSCGCLHRSLGEIEIEKILIDNKLSFVKQYPIPGHRFDFAIKNNSDKIIRLIEFDGEQHFTNIANWDSVELQQQRDQKKNEYALTHNIPLVRIPYWERDNITLEMILGSTYEVREAGQPTG